MIKIFYHTISIVFLFHHYNFYIKANNVHNHDDVMMYMVFKAHKV